MAGENKCKGCGQWAGKGHSCPTPMGTAVAERPDIRVLDTSAGADRDAVSERVMAAQNALYVARVREAVVSRDVAAMVANGFDSVDYDIDPSEGSLGWLDYNDAWRQQWDADRISQVAARDGYAGDANVVQRQLIPDTLTAARNRVQGYMYEQYGVAVSNEEASRAAWESLEEAGVERTLDGGLTSTPAFANRLAALAEEKAPAVATRPSPFGVDLPEPDRPLSVVTPQELGALERRVDEAVLMGRPGTFTDQEVATLRASMLPTPRELSLRMHQINGRIKRMNESEGDNRSRGDYAIAEMEMSDTWSQFTGTAPGRDLAAEISGRNVGSAAALDRAAARRRFTIATGIAADPAWEDGYNATPPNLPYGNGCDCNRFKWTGVCPHTNPAMAKREYVQAAVAKAANEFWGNSEVGKAARKEGIMTGGKKPGFFRRLFG